MDTVKAVIQKVIQEGKHGPFAVATSNQLEGSVTFSLEPTVWKEKEWPEEGMMVYLGELRRKRAGWRAKNGRFWKPSDEQTQQTERSKTMKQIEIGSVIFANVHTPDIPEKKCSKCGQVLSKFEDGEFRISNETALQRLSEAGLIPLKSERIYVDGVFGEVHVREILDDIVEAGIVHLAFPTSHGGLIETMHFLIGHKKWCFGSCTGEWWDRNIWFPCKQK